MTTFTSTSHPGFKLNTTRKEISLILATLAENEINLRAVDIYPVCECTFTAVLIPGIVGESNKDLYIKAKEILDDLDITWCKVYWVVVDNQPIPGQFLAVWDKLGCLVHKLQFGGDESGLIGIVTTQPTYVKDLLLRND